MEPLEKIQLVVDALASKKAHALSILDLRGLTVIADYFVIATGSSPLNIRALAEAVLDTAKKSGVRNTRVEGMQDATWVLIDLGDVVAHIFDAEHREFYQLERLWADAPRLPVPEEG